MKRSQAYWFDSIDSMKNFKMDNDDEDGIFFFVNRSPHSHWLYVWRNDNSIIDNGYTRIKALGHGVWILQNPDVVSRWFLYYNFSVILNEASNQNLEYKLTQL